MMLPPTATSVTLPVTTLMLPLTTTSVTLPVTTLTLPLTTTSATLPVTTLTLPLTTTSVTLPVTTLTLPLTTTSVTLPVTTLTLPLTTTSVTLPVSTPTLPLTTPCVTLPVTTLTLPLTTTSSTLPVTTLTLHLTTTSVTLPVTTLTLPLTTTSVTLPVTTLTLPLTTTSVTLPHTTLTLPLTTTTVTLPVTTLTLPLTTTSVTLPVTTLTLPLTTTSVTLPVTTLTLPLTTTSVTLPATTLTLRLTTTSVTLPVTTLTLPLTTTSVTLPATTLTLRLTTTSVTLPAPTLTLTLPTTIVTLPATTLTLPLTTTTVTLPVTTLTLPLTTTSVTLPVTTLTLPLTTTSVTLPVTTLTLPLTTTSVTLPVTTLTLPPTTTSATLPLTTLTLPPTTTSATLPATTLTSPPTTTLTTPAATPPAPAPLFELALTLRPARSPSSVPERMGAALAASGGTFVIGAPGDGSAAPDAGIVYVVSASSPTFGRLLRVLRKPGTPAAGDAFGAAVAAIGQSVLVGAPGDNTGAPGAGAAFVFGPTDSAPTILLPPAPAAQGAFGAAVAADVADDLAVGAPGTGTVHLFRRATGGPLLTIPSPPGAGRFGSAIAAVGANLLVGAPGSGNAPGKAFLFPAGSGSPRLMLTNPNPLAAAGDQFGFAVATDGSRLLIGAPGAGAVFLFSFQTGELIRKFENPTPRAGDRFGASIAVTAAGLLVGAPSDGEVAPAGGAAYLFDLETGELRGVLRKEGARPEDLFGTAVAGFGASVLVGAPGDDAGLVDGGAAYLFSGGTLEAVFRKRLSAAAFGASVAAAGADVLVGAPRGASGAGSVGRFDGASGAALATLESPAPGDSSFGFSVAALGSDVVVGAPFQATAEGPDVGEVYRFTVTALARTFVNPQPIGGDQFGFSIATSGADVVVGVPLAGARDVGLAYLLDGVTGAPRVIFQKPIPVAGDFFGAAVAADGDEVLVGAPLDSEPGPNAGAAYLFRRDTATLERAFQSPSPAAGDLFGAAVALAGARLVIGAPSAAGGATEAVAVYVFDRASGNLLVTIENPTPDPGDQFGSAVAIAGENVLVGAQLDDAGALDTGAAYLFDGGTGALLQTFPSPAQGAFDHFGFALAAGPSGLLVGAPGPSRVYVFRPAGRASAALRAETIRPAARGPRCGNGIVEPSEECDDGNAVDTDDCRNNCTRPICCTLDPLQQERCDDNDPCTDDSLDPTAGCIHVPNGRCCERDTDCGSGTCRVCDGCFLLPWACCAQGSTCQALAPECGGTRCLAGAYCRCEWGLACPGEAVPARTQTLFTAACDQVRLGGGPKA